MYNMLYLWVAFLQHHCRKCGAVVCGACSNRRFLLPQQSDRPLRVCIACFNTLEASHRDNGQLVICYVYSVPSKLGK